MYLSELRIWNFRKYGVIGTGEELDKVQPGVVIFFEDGLNVLIGENDSGKTTVVDAVRFVLGTQSREWTRIEEDDFYERGGHRAEKLRMECVFRGFTDEEAAPFLEWMGFEREGEQSQYVLSVRMTAQRRSNGVFPDWRAGPDPVGSQMEGEARDRLLITYLKPLRDADAELTPGRRSRLAQILKAHALFQNAAGRAEQSPHRLEEIVQQANREIEKYFKPPASDEGLDRKAELDAKEDLDPTSDVEADNAGELLRALGEYLKEFFPKNSLPNAQIKISGGDLSEILRKLSLMIDDNPPGLGTQNLLYIAAELLLLQPAENLGLRLGVVEELEAHLHPQAQLRLTHFLQDEAQHSQFILTTHSTTLGASIDLKSMVICKNDKAFPMGPKSTELQPKGYEFLQRFLDATKANLFFASGVILVEGDSESLLLPTIAEIVGRPLHRYGVSVVNVGSTAFLHYAKIFSRKDGQTMGIPVSVVTDMDVKPLEHEDQEQKTQQEIDAEKEERKAFLEDQYGGEETKVFVSPNWTLEYEIALTCLKKPLYRSVLWVRKKMNSTTGDPQDGKEDEITSKCKEDFAQWNGEWKDDGRKDERIAFEIYSNCLLKKRVSKPWVAQELAAWMCQCKDRRKLTSAFLESPSLRYLVGAICHVTEPIPRSSTNGD